MMTIICAWCGDNLGTKPGGNGETHGICPDCADTLRKKHGLQPSSLRAQKITRAVRENTESRDSGKG